MMAWHRSRLVLACIAVHCVLPADRPTHSTGAQVGPDARRSPPIALRYVANAGVLLTKSGVDILIDAPIRDGIPPYATSGVAEREKLEQARSPYDRVAAILITHWHEDHFDARAVAAHLAANGNAVLISSPEVVDRVRAVAPALESARLRAVLPAPGTSDLVRLGPLPIRVLRIRHNPTRRLPEQHVGFLVGEPSAVLHTGDADLAPDNFALLRNLPPVDLAIVPFWFVQGESNWRFVRTALAPRRTAALHLPPADAEPVRHALEVARRPVVLLAEPGTAVALEPQ
jgi:L-ascorbate metabolism protein UlaG (beta-lactamase superfamily)